MTARTDGASLAELVVVLALLLTISAFAVPSLTSARDEGRARQAAAFVAARLRAARTQAVMRGTSTALVFDFLAGRWIFRLCVDGNLNGVRRSDLSLRRDTCMESPADVAGLFPGTAIAVDSSLRGPDGEPGSGDPVRFGASDIASFSPPGTGTAGTVFIRSAHGVQYAVRVAGTTARLRLLRYDRAADLWREQ